MLLRVLTLIAVVLMPIGMTATPGAAAVTTTATSADDHCGDHPMPADAPSKASVHCMACSALPATDELQPVELMILQLPLSLAIATPISGVEPEIVPPPPKRF